MPTDTFIPTRPSLLARLKDGEEQAGWQEFLDTYGRLIRGAALKSGLTETEADDVLQETALAVVKNIKEFKYDPARCSFKSWLLLITRQRIIWQVRERERAGAQGSPGALVEVERGRLKPGLRTDHGPRTATIDRIPDPAGLDLDVLWDEEWQNNLMAAALDTVKREVNPKQYQMFDFYVLQKWPARDVARTLKVNVAQVYLAKHRISALVKKEAAKLEKKQSLTR
jgi:RNA polymerase sigma-70 factor (ECF subfamily)